MIRSKAEQLLAELLEWDANIGGHESKVWDRARTYMAHVRDAEQKALPRDSLEASRQPEDMDHRELTAIVRDVWHLMYLDLDHAGDVVNVNKSRNEPSVVLGDIAATLENHGLRPICGEANG
jgi:hypothetical protein